MTIQSCIPTCPPSSSRSIQPAKYKIKKTTNHKILPSASTTNFISYQNGSAYHHGLVSHTDGDSQPQVSHASSLFGSVGQFYLNIDLRTDFFSNRRSGSIDIDVGWDDRCTDVNRRRDIAVMAVTFSLGFLPVLLQTFTFLQEPFLALVLGLFRGTLGTEPTLLLTVLLPPCLLLRVSGVDDRRLLLLDGGTVRLDVDLPLCQVGLVLFHLPLVPFLIFHRPVLVDLLLVFGQSIPLLPHHTRDLLVCQSLGVGVASLPNILRPVIVRTRRWPHRLFGTFRFSAHCCCCCCFVERKEEKMSSVDPISFFEVQTF
mmetsp:Transcript_1197/g.2601  ORF Transcript_1197/g.2601 Transcript_1197/m.2601 type:complete len:314 (-) Transcript_1197:71-1012(-)